MQGIQLTGSLLVIDFEDKRSLFTQVFLSDREFIFIVVIFSRLMTNDNGAKVSLDDPAQDY